jgi:hypothetical protein
MDAKSLRWSIDAGILNQMRYPMHHLLPILLWYGGTMDLFQCVGVREADAPPSLLNSKQKNNGYNIYIFLWIFGKWRRTNQTPRICSPPNDLP